MHISNRQILCSLLDPKDFDTSKAEILRLNKLLAAHMQGIAEIKNGPDSDLESPEVKQERLEHHRKAQEDIKKEITKHEGVVSYHKLQRPRD